MAKSAGCSSGRASEPAWRALDHIACLIFLFLFFCFSQKQLTRLLVHKHVHTCIWRHMNAIIVYLNVTNIVHIVMHFFIFLFLVFVFLRSSFRGYMRGSMYTYALAGT